ncbi:formimidoylglutamase [Mesonia aestuariivivens]|uniref:Formimidoylglutamase n=1 Tax=Mesonia aestuariivivens TaxID=2796128 RepID=A0ABS6W2F6_9FLAO|nr:formimidoylglutamase [Mesonia aestuariivivens]MBW2962035.1 formimidoylglutamase [Mesonia aestuariivivens]
MESFDFYTKNRITHYIKHRKGETKLGEALEFIPSFEDLESSEARYVIFGIPEDIGVRGNFGQPGTSKAWSAFLNSFCNIQVNEYNDPKNCMILGEINCSSFTKASLATYTKFELGEIVQQIDAQVTMVVEKIVRSGKTPVIIGGGHNNAYGNIKGTSQALERPIHVLNIDAHTDLRETDYRHSGNGFKYAKEEKLLDRYAMVGIHKNYTPQYIFDEMNKDKHIKYTFLDDYLHLTTIEKLIKFKKATDFVRNNFGLEIDCDSIKNFDSSAMTPSGFNVNEIRSFIKLSKKQEVLYLHLCEASPEKNAMIGKALSYFVSDFIREEK